ncbi:MAG: ABC transporter ATP-binding protein [Anaerolineae bacterium]|nr:ABC transporter ATP-binding protein [Anaerolineae bacterium]
MRNSLMKKIPILQIEDLYKQFPVTRTFTDRIKRAPKQVVHALDGVSFTVDQGEILALVGESGSGKTTVGMNVLGLQVPTKGRILFDGYDVADWATGRLRSRKNGDELGRLSRRKQILALRRRAQMVFQDPYESLNPRQTTWEIVVEPLEIHHLGLSADEKEARVRAALEDCGLAPADHFWSRYPDELSGGQRQRVVVAGALVLEPELLVADEPVSMLDVSIRADILTLLQSLRKARDITIIYTTHDLATAGYFTDRMAVMYLGRIVELGSTVEVLKEPHHPYTQALVSVAPVPNPRKRRKRMILQGEVPNPIDVPSGCRFHPRCPIATEECKMTDPPYVEISTGHKAACLKI